MALLDFLIEVIGYSMARLNLPLLWLGRIHIAPLGAPWKEPNTLGYRHDEDGLIEMDSRTAPGRNCHVSRCVWGGLLIGVAA